MYATWLIGLWITLLICRKVCFINHKCISFSRFNGEYFMLRLSYQALCNVAFTIVLEYFLEMLHSAKIILRVLFVTYFGCFPPHRSIIIQPNIIAVAMCFCVRIQENYGCRFYGKAINVIRGMKESFDELFKRYDIIIVLTIKYRPPLLPKAGLTVTGKNSVHECLVFD